MSNVEPIEHDVQALSPAELATFRKWFREFDAEDMGSSTVRRRQGWQARHPC